MMLILTFKATYAFVALFATLDAAFWVLAAGNMIQSQGCIKAGGVLCVISACCGWYAMIAGMADKFNSYITFHGLPMPVYEKRNNLMIIIIIITITKLVMNIYVLEEK